MMNMAPPEFGITAAADAITAQKTPMEHAEHTLHHRISDERRAKRDYIEFRNCVSGHGCFLRTLHRHTFAGAPHDYFLKKTRTSRTRA